MPRKIRQLKAMLKKAGFTQRPGKGSHSIWSHPQVPFSITLSGKDGRDARRYQEKRVKEALDLLRANP
jgi:predicted RNA binding protein YcfA (HicA-like mRNA interferase family)